MTSLVRPRSSVGVPAPLRTPAFCGWLACVVAFTAMAVMAAVYDRFPGDLGAARRWIAVDPPVLSGAMRFITDVGKPWPAGIIGVSLAVALALARRPLEAGLTLATFPARAVGEVVKRLVERPRPDEALVRVIDDGSTSFSFPSGHALTAVLFYGLVWWMAGRVIPWQPVRWLVRAWCAFIIVTTPASRVYLGAHWPSDVVGGALLGGILLAALLWAGAEAERRWPALRS
ncbi:MAG TPA: phosphatase PAP2 family protein [Dehalococcoidia bacterium]|nr:phosphatase PAP2 family protein [Dehalococcoidia bacterium]